MKTTTTTVVPTVDDYDSSRRREQLFFVLILPIKPVYLETALLFLFPTFPILLKRSSSCRSTNSRDCTVATTLPTGAPAAAAAAMFAAVLFELVAVEWSMRLHAQRRP
jgi:hypothetical protein